MPTQRDPLVIKLGKLSPSHDPRTLLLVNYLNTETLPPAPVTFTYAKNIAPAAWGMMANDKLGDCTCAAAGHLIMEWTDDNNALFTPTDEQIIAAYSAITGYDPVTGKNDNGAVETAVLNYWRSTGIAGHQIFAYVALEPKNHGHISIATFLFGGCYIGMSLPFVGTNTKSMVSSSGRGSGQGCTWIMRRSCGTCNGYDSHGLTVITWGATKRMTWSFWDAYCDEAYAIISTDFAAKNTAPSGFDLCALEQDLKKR